MFVELLGKLDIVPLDDVAAADLVHDVLPVNWKLELLNVEINTICKKKFRSAKFLLLVQSFQQIEIPSLISTFKDLLSAYHISVKHSNFNVYSDKEGQGSLCVAGPHVVAPKSPPVVCWPAIGPL